MNIGERIKAARTKAGLTQAQLAERTGVAMITISQYERGIRQPRMEQLRKIAFALGLYISDLVDGTEEGWRSFPPDELRRDFSRSNAHTRMNAAFDKLNENGQNIAAERVEELTKIPDYQKKND